MVSLRSTRGEASGYQELDLNFLNRPETPTTRVLLVSPMCLIRFVVADPSLLVRASASAPNRCMGFHACGAYTSQKLFFIFDGASCRLRLVFLIDTITLCKLYYYIQASQYCFH
jgi:hypothetical protein